MTLKLYSYNLCGSCRKAKKFLDSRGIKYQEIPIRIQPPTKGELKQMAAKLHLKRLFNTSGQDYRLLNIKEKRETLTIKEQIELLHSNGNLIKRPFAIGTAHGKTIHITGFKEEEWKQLFP
ncbi:Spx/MgsR family RNA polymerase-binding regulatory protein [archaeon]|jgi:arsenate reductase|nr:Spx/MgsR family RNA polymerase-binding regulatory protein [archaeon]MBT6697953.1 Spx/MgsR family RNA polymerase-binding regulatory protein [archaeon]